MIDLKGQHVQVSMLDSSFYFMWPETFGNYSFTGQCLYKLNDEFFY